jgi:hypothetical protein
MIFFVLMLSFFLTLLEAILVIVSKIFWFFIFGILGLLYFEFILYLESNLANYDEFPV